MTTVQVRVDQSTKISVETILKNMGLDMSTAIRMYLKKIEQMKAIPFSLSQTPSLYNENGFTKEETQSILSAWKESKNEKQRERFASMDEAIASLSK